MTKMQKKARVELESAADKRARARRRKATPEQRKARDENRARLLMVYENLEDAGDVMLAVRDVVKAMSESADGTIRALGIGLRITTDSVEKSMRGAWDKLGAIDIK